MATFDPNRVGPGTFELIKDPSTGEYKLNQVGFTKLPDLSLPTIDQAPYVIPDDEDDDTGNGNQTPDPGAGGGGSGGGGGQDQTFVNFPTPDSKQDFTGEETFKNIQKQATDISKADMGIQMEDISPGSANRVALKAYNDALQRYNLQTELNRDRAMGKQTPEPEADLELANAKNEVDMRRKEYEDTIVNIGAAPVISEDLQKFGPRTVPSGTLTGAKVEDVGKTFRSETDKFKTRFDPTKIEPAEVEPSIMEKAKNIVENSLVVKVASGVGKVLKGINDSIIGPEQVALNNSNKNALSSLGYKTRGELGGSTDPGRIAGNPANDVFAGMNMTSARGDVMNGARKRVSTRKSAKTQERISKLSPERQKAFNDKTAEFEAQIEAAQAKKNQADLATGGAAPGAGGGGGGSGSKGKSIVCTAMYQTTGLQDWAKAMKIWYIYQKRYLTIQHQEGYHKLFKPFVKGMHKSNIIKAIGAHFAKHRTQHLKHVMFNSKPSLLGKIYNKILEPICYWAGRK